MSEAVIEIERGLGRMAGEADNLMLRAIQAAHRALGYIVIDARDPANAGQVTSQLIDVAALIASATRHAAALKTVREAAELLPDRSAP